MVQNLSKTTWRQASDLEMSVELWNNRNDERVGQDWNCLQSPTPASSPVFTITTPTTFDRRQNIANNYNDATIVDR